MLFNLNPGHTLSGGDVGTRGINGLKEEVLTRQLVNEIDKELRGRGHSTSICRVDYASTLQESLNKQVALCNSVNGDLNICIHFNTTVGGYGSEIYTYNGKYLIEADRILKQLDKLGFRNRGIKDQPLALTKRTKAKTIYIEVCFIDSSHDVAILNKYGMNGIAKAIVNGVLGVSSNVSSKPVEENTNTGWINLDGKIGTICTPSGVNVREKKSTSSRILGTLPNGVKVQLYRKEGKWMHVYYPAHGGYIYSKYIRY
ncbi:N-acetylmuramoyl-L-alanine amidase [Clostridium sporogenes]|uniref:N-acetylmuramoyl-L-alanine amidase n=3 Tax=Clostridium TaxID=1485 RepID=A0A7X5P6R1_CLOSG|nr:N-acetylmuramoyl-L-alanine amidase [Clostridium sporogenes]AJD31758.1 N-acetylmuramoyl-L-alanine amidase family protein [Clostridium botulinum Prevot_594]AVP61039.1 N-acetylmuramoyl-L-alanine amidase [Clostridium botulinum]AKC63825.1 N-acetylmuramoyl-L-alanine amidase [Clostridium sporogenes]AKJ90973.1 N-acetylmuramoyl-L-alanine amidase [Clostridium sporogenes]AVP64198.1 N-acetylmuramoyl-L-alanine amidase [Clostridium botulinum]